MNREFASFDGPHITKREQCRVSLCDCVCVRVYVHVLGCWRVSVASGVDMFCNIIPITAARANTARLAPAHVSGQ